MALWHGGRRSDLAPIDFLSIQARKQTTALLAVNEAATLFMGRSGTRLKQSAENGSQNRGNKQSGGNKRPRQAETNKNKHRRHTTQPDNGDKKQKQKLTQSER
jgi:hypothetical protein